MANNSLLSIQTITITPEAAAQLLSRNTSNRKISESLVETLKLGLERGEWVFNGEAIKIAADGTVLDGQHRLTACSESGIPFETVFITGLPNESQYTMDTGKARTLKDMLKIKGESNETQLSSIIFSLIRYEQWGLRIAIQPSQTGYRVTVKQGLDYLDRNPWVRDLAKKGERLRSTGLTGRLGALLYHVFSTIDQDDADFFFEKLITGEDLSKGDPILALRNWLIANRKNEERPRQDRSSYEHMAAIAIKAWNKYRAGEDALTLLYRPGGKVKEQFPVAK